MYDDYNTIENHQWIPKQAFLYFPNGDSTKRQEDDFKLILQKGELKRLIYEGGIEYTEEQNQVIQKYRKFLEQKQFHLGHEWSKAYLYKFLQSTGYDYKKSMKQILAYNDYRKTLRQKDFEELRRRTEPILKEGLIYFNGRDAKFRPLIVCDIKKIHEKKLKDQQLFQVLQYYFEFIYRNMFVNGQAENVVGVIDVGGTSPIDLIKPMKMTISFLQGNYKYKLHAVYIIRSTSMFQMAYSIAKQFMKEDTIRKIFVIKQDKAIEPLLEYVNPSQLQKKFGGTHKNLQNDEFWPPRQFSNDYFHPKVIKKIITVDEYARMYQQGLLPQRKIYLDYIADSEGSLQIPVLNNLQPSMKFINQSTIITQKRQKSLIQRAISRVTCGGCFGDRPKRQRRSSRKIER